MAEAETVAGLDAGIAATFDDRLAQGPILALEVNLRIKTIQTCIAKLDSVGFAANFMAYIEAAAYLLEEGNQLMATSDLLVPVRGQVPTLDKHGPFDPTTEQVAKDAILAYGIRSALADQARPETMMDLETASEDLFSGQFPGKPVFDHWNEKPSSLAGLDQTVVSIIKALLRNEYIGPSDFWMAGLRLFEWINQSDFKPFLTPRLAAWLRSGWKRRLTAEAFCFFNPWRTIPLTEKVLTMPTDDRSFIANLLLVAAEAVEAPLSPTYRAFLKAMAEETPSPSNVA